MWSIDRIGLMLDQGQKHPQFLDRELLTSLLVEDISAIGAEIEGLVCDLSLQMVRHVQESFDQVSMHELGELVKVDLTLDVASPEQFVVAPRLTIGITVSSDGQTTSQEVVSLVFAHLLLQSVEQVGYRLNEESASEKVAFLSCQTESSIEPGIEQLLLLYQIFKLLRPTEERLMAGQVLGLQVRWRDKHICWMSLLLDQR